MKKERYNELVTKARDLVVKKGEDYNTNVELHAYFPFGHQSYAQMIYLKALRTVSLVASDKEPNFDSIEDTLLDLLNYTVFYLDRLNADDL